MIRSSLLAAFLFTAVLGIPFAKADSITTTFASNNGFTGNMFDITSFGVALSITAFDVNVTAGSVPISVYYRSGTYVGHETSSAGWTLAGTVTVTSAGTDTMTLVDTPDFVIPSGSVTGLYVTINDPTGSGVPEMNYTNGANIYSNSNIQITTGDGEGGLFGAAGVFTPRTWNGTIVYTPTTVPEPSSLVMIGAGAIGVMGMARYRKAKA